MNKRWFVIELMEFAKRFFQHNLPFLEKLFCSVLCCYDKKQLGKTYNPLKCEEIERYSIDLKRRAT